MENSLNNGLIAIDKQQNDNDLSFAKLHISLSVLMTRFHYHQCPKLALFIVKHISIMIEHPELTELADCRTQYLQLLQQWQNITGSLLEQRKVVATNKITIH